MPALGEDLRFGYPHLVPEEHVAAPAIDLELAVQGLYQRMFELAPSVSGKPVFLREAVVSESPKVQYPTPNDPSHTTMSAWLARVKWKPGRGPFSGSEQGGEEVKLITQATHLLESRKLQLQPRTERVVAAAGKLTIWLRPAHQLMLEGLRPEAAANIVADINDTLDLFVR